MPILDRRVQLEAVSVFAGAASVTGFGYGWHDGSFHLTQDGFDPRSAGLVWMPSGAGDTPAYSRLSELTANPRAIGSSMGIRFRIGDLDSNGVNVTDAFTGLAIGRVVRIGIAAAGRDDQAVLALTLLAVPTHSGSLGAQAVTLDGRVELVTNRDRLDYLPGAGFAFLPAPASLPAVPFSPYSVWGKVEGGVNTFSIDVAGATTTADYDRDLTVMTRYESRLAEFDFDNFALNMTLDGEKYRVTSLDEGNRRRQYLTLRGAFIGSA